MEHSEAVEKMAAERYLLNELTPNELEAFEDHLFDCPECALDLRAGAAFVDEAKAQLPELTANLPAPARVRTEKLKLKPSRWLSWCRPAFAVPAFAALLMLVGYQNLITYPALRIAANVPRLYPTVPLHGATRGDTRLTVTTNRKSGIALPVSLPQAPGLAAYSSFAFDLYDPQQKLVWTSLVAAPSGGEDGGQSLSLTIPGIILQNGSYSVTVSGIAPQGQRDVIERYAFDLRLTD